MKAYQTLFAVLLLVLTSMVGIAAAKEPISIVSKAEIEETVVNEQGEKETRRVPAAKVMPGTIVFFTNTCTNVSDSPIDDVVINNPIPEHTVYIDSSATEAGVAVTFSTDNGNTFDAPGNLFIVEQDGTSRPATGRDYTHVRWQLKSSLKPGESKDVEFRARLK
ncbi:DUF11 domain-containing protein [Desulfosediminicola ganghwensis]|uniref:DUF11 domain-containing protein n=1 Tax=Desulfosediminicola ganghwensis TaxID=2569540 RepID=UPI0010ACFBAA|nr:DUF11 domain-containing protein [Desulfosediminicola ganghwensis]